MRRETQDLSRYLAEISAYSILEPEQEQALAGEMKDARKNLARVVLMLPREIRDRAASGCDGKPQEWTFETACGFRDALLLRSTSDNRATAEIVEQVARFERTRTAMIEANLRLVVQMARQFLDPGVGLIDLIQEGNVGLIKAVERFDPDRGNRFSTYAFWWIKQSIERAIKDKKKLIRLPSNVEDVRRRARRVVGELANKLGREPQPREVAEVVGIDEDKLAGILRLTQQVVDSSEDMSWLENVEDVDDVSPYRQAEVRDLRQHVERMLQQLSPREREILRLRFGIGGDERGLPLREVGRLVDVSRERVRQIALNALKKLRRVATSNDGLAPHADCT